MHLVSAYYRVRRRQTAGYAVRERMHDHAARQARRRGWPAQVKAQEGGEGGTARIRPGSGVMSNGGSD